MVVLLLYTVLPSDKRKVRRAPADVRCTAFL